MYEWPMIDWNRLRTVRRDRMCQMMKQTGLDHVLLTGHDNIRYATDYRSMLIVEAFDWYAAVVDQAGEASIFVPYVAKDVAKPELDLPWIMKFIATPSWVPSMSQAPIWTRLLANEIRGRGAKRVGVELLTFQFIDALRHELPEVEFLSVAESLYEIRQVKDAEEIRLLEAASTVNSLATSEALSRLNEGMTDYDVLAIVMEYMQSSGVEYVTHSLCVARDVQVSGNWFAKGRRLWEGDACFFDVGCYGIGGYASDMCRTGFVGEPPRPVKKAYDALLQAYRAGQEVAKAGIRVAEIDRTINEALRKQGLSTTPYSMGHGVGLRACELPIIYRPEMMVKDEVLVDGMVISLEPETVVESRGHPVVLKIEDNFVVERQGLRRLTLSGYRE